MRHERGPLLVSAGPGSGKTTVIIHRTARLLQEDGISPDQLMVVTFSRRAAAEMLHRIQALLARSDVRITRRQFATIHSLGYQILRRYDGPPDVLSGKKVNRLLRQILAERELYDRRDPLTLRDLKSEISYVRANRIPFSDIGQRYRPQVLDAEDFVALLQSYQRRKEQQGASDFADLLEDALELIKNEESVRSDIQGRIQYVMLDEAQDTSPLQFDLISEVAAPQNNIAVVGDDDQSIYSFRGADPDLLLRFPDMHQHVQVVKITTNYRSAGNLVQLSRRLIDHNRRRFPKELRALADRKTTIECVQPRDEIDQTAHILRAAHQNRAMDRAGQMAVLYRSNVQAVPLIEALTRQGHPFRLLSSGGAHILHHPILEDMMAFLRLVDDPEKPQTADVQQLINKPTRYIPHRTIQQLRQQLPQLTGEIWRHLLAHPDLSGRQREEIRKLYQGLLDYRREEGEKGDAAKLDDFLNRSPFHYDQYLRDQSDEPDRVQGYRHRFRMFQSLARSDGFLEHIQGMRQAAAGAANTAEDDAGLVLSTCHAAKGLQWPQVWIMDAVDGVMPSSAIRSRRRIGDEEEERRLFYVAVTRAVEGLTVSIPHSGADGPLEPSPFVEESGLLDSGDPRIRSRQRRRQKRRSTRSASSGQKAKDSRERDEQTQGVRHPIRDANALRPGRRLVHATFGCVRIKEVYPDDRTVQITTEAGEDRNLHIPACLNNELLGYPEGGR